MPIRVEKKDKITNFYIETENTMYQMTADEYGVLKHIWYGKKTSSDMNYLYSYPDVGFSGNLYDAGNNRTYSIDTLPLEYSYGGTGDYRISAVDVRHEYGGCSLDLRFSDYEIKNGKYSIPKLPSVYSDENKSQTLEIKLKDTASGVEVTLKYGVLPDLDIITRSAVISNNSASDVVVEKAFSACLDIPNGKWEWIHFTGRHTMERIPQRTALINGIQESSSKRGTSSHQQNPTAIICSTDCTETTGECYGAALMYSGSFKTQIELDQFSQLRMVIGINPELFSWHLGEGESFYTPEVILSFSSDGFEKLTHNFHKVIRENVCPQRFQNVERPVLINNWEATYFDFNEEKILKIAQKASELGVDMLVLDDGWFGKRNDDCSGLGDWFVNEDKLKGGLAPLVEKINALGMKFGIWFEPEMISEDSDLYRKHPDWAIQIPDRKPCRSRYQLVLDMSNDEVCEYLYKVISDILKSANISYVKWDMNRSISDWYTMCLSSEKQGEMPHRYVLGLYGLLERLTNDFPDVLVEGCSGGGGRYDAGMMYYCPQIWCSDDTDAYERTKIQYGSSFFYPVSTNGSHVSAVPNHQTGRVTSIEARATVAMAGSFGYELDLNLISEEEKREVTNQIKKFKEYRKLIHHGDYYRLSDATKDDFAVWAFSSEDKSELLVCGLIFRTSPNSLRYNIKLRGLLPDKKYVLCGTDEVYSGDALMNGGILLPKTWGDYAPVELYFKEAEEK
jgi:alpha-galactosidase